VRCASPADHGIIMRHDDPGGTRFARTALLLVVTQRV